MFVRFLDREFPTMNLWMQAFENTGVDIDFYNLRASDGEDELVPVGFHRYRCDNRKFLQQRNGIVRWNEKVTPNCRYAVFRMWRSEIWRRCLL